jgi:alpha-beta hydrolase superfamily lysophospholipase
MLGALTVLLFAQFGTPAVAARPVVAGHWEGVVRRGASQLAIRLDLADGARNRNFFSAPDLGAIDIPLSHVRAGRTLHAELVGDTTPTLIDATVDGNVMTGTFREPAMRTGTIRLHRVDASIARPYATQPATFANGDVHLGGTMYVPRTSGKHPAVVLVQGSGPEGRWATAYIADALARHGVIALSYDKRGVGGSSGDWRTATFDDLAADARAAVHVLAQRPDVDPSRIGVYGHSQGGFIAPLIAENDTEVAWIGDADGPVGPQYRQDLFRVDTALAKRYSGRDLADAEKLYAEFVDTARNGTPHARLRTDMAEAGDPDWLDDLAIPDDDSWIWPWYAKTGNADNSAAWGAVHVPVLILFGANDEIVPPRDSVAETVRILKEHDNTNVTVHVFVGADHTLRIPPTGRDGWPHNARGFPDVLAAFAQHPGTSSR